MLDGTSVVYAARARLLRIADSVVIWERNCAHAAEVDVPRQGEEYHPTVNPTAQPEPTRQMRVLIELVANDGRLLKAKLRETAEGCADKLFASSLTRVR